MKKFLVLIIFCVSLQAMGQGNVRRFQWGIEAGAVKSGWPYRSAFSGYQNYFYYRAYKPMFSLLLGVYGDYRINKILGISSGLQFFQSGGQQNEEHGDVQYNYKTKEYSPVIDYTFYNYQFNNLSLPVLFTFSPLSRGMKPTLSLGVRVNYRLSGSTRNNKGRVSSDPEFNGDGNFQFEKNYGLFESGKLKFQPTAQLSVMLKQAQFTFGYSTDNMLYLLNGATSSTDLFSLSMKYPLSRSGWKLGEKFYPVPVEKMPQPK